MGTTFRLAISIADGKDALRKSPQSNAGLTEGATYPKPRQGLRMREGPSLRYKKPILRGGENSGRRTGGYN